MVSLTAWQQALAADSGIPLPTKGFLLVVTINCDWKTGTGVKPGTWLQDKGISRSQSYEHLGRAIKAGYLAKDGRIYRLALPEKSGIPDGEASQEVRDTGQNSPGCRTESAETVRDTGPVSNQSNSSNSHQSSDDVTVSMGLTGQSQNLTGTGPVSLVPSSSALGEDSPVSGPASDQEWVDETWETALEAINHVVSGGFVTPWKGKPAFDPRFLAKKHQVRLVELLNRYQLDVYDLTYGMFSTGVSGKETPDHNRDRIQNPAKFYARILAGDPAKIVEYGERGKKIWAEFDAEDQAAQTPEQAEATIVPAA
jgi:hypothetical protein